jgi:hypothetical protein
LQSGGNIHVKFVSDRLETFAYSWAGWIEDLQWAIAANEGIRMDKVQLFQEAVHCTTAMRISDLPSDSLTFITESVTVRFVCPVGVHELVLPPQVTVSDARAVVAARICTEPDNLKFLVDGERMPNAAVVAEGEITVEFITAVKFMYRVVKE